MALRERVHGILLAANGGEERMVASGVSECLYNAGLGLRYVQVSGCGITQEDESMRCILVAGVPSTAKVGH